MNKSEPKPRSRPRTPNNRTTTGFQISDDLWTVLEPLLPVHVNPHRFGGGRPRMADRACADAIFYVLRDFLPVARAGPDRAVRALNRARPIPSLGRSRRLPEIMASGSPAI